MAFLSAEQQGTLCALLLDYLPVDDLEPFVQFRLNVQLANEIALNNAYAKVAFDFVSWLEKAERSRDFLTAVRDHLHDRPTLREFCAAALAAPPQGAREVSHVVGTVRQLRELLSGKPAQDAFALYKQSFREAAEQIAELGRYKSLHDDFQAAEETAILFNTDRDGLSTPAAELLRNRLELVVDYAEKPEFAAATVGWRAQVGRAAKNLSDALDAADGPRVAQVVGRVREQIRLELPKQNSKIVELARKLSLQAVACGLRAVHDDARAGLSDDEDAARQLERFEKGLTALDGFDDELRTLVGNHDHYQAVDGILLQLGDGREPDLILVADIWEDVLAHVVALLPYGKRDREGKLVARAKKVAGAISPRPTEAGPVRLLQDDVTAFRMAHRLTFNQTDVDLRDLCGRLKTPGEELAEAIREMQHA